MKRASYVLAVSFMLLTLLPGCGRWMTWGKDIFYQGGTIPFDKPTVVRNLRTMRIYDEYETLGIFDALWLCDDIRLMYTDVVATERGFFPEQRRAHARRQLEENNHHISFYILSSRPFHVRKNTAPWSLYLTIAGIKYAPLSITSVDLEPEYQAFFGKRYNIFNKPYLIQFAATDVEGAPIITHNTDKIELVFTDVTKRAVLCWKLDQEGRAIAPSDRVFHQRACRPSKSCNERRWWCCLDVKATPGELREHVPAQETQEKGTKYEDCNRR